MARRTPSPITTITRRYCAGCATSIRSIGLWRSTPTTTRWSLSKRLACIDGARVSTRRHKRGDLMAQLEEISSALAESGLDGWLFYDFRMSDPLAYRILDLPETGITTRR